MQPSPIFLTSCHSTQEEAEAGFQVGRYQDGDFVLTHAQTAGKGAGNTVWLSEPGKNLTGTLIRCPERLEPNLLVALNKRISMALFFALQNLLPEPEFLKVKWPNDLYFRDEKLGGILITTKWQGQGLKAIFIGIGLNVNQLKFNLPRATSLALLLGKELSLLEMVDRLSENLKVLWADKMGITEQLNHEYLVNLYGLNQKMRFQSAQGEWMGIVRNITENGDILIESEQGIVRFGYKEVQFIG